MGTIANGLGNGIGRHPSSTLFNNAPELRPENVSPLGLYGNRQAIRQYRASDTPRHRSG